MDKKLWGTSVYQPILIAGRPQGHLESYIFLAHYIVFGSLMGLI